MSSRYPHRITWANSSPTSYVYGPGNLPLERISPTGEAHYYHADQLGSTRVVTDDDGDVAATATYDPYGKLSSSTGTLDQPLAFAGEYTDTETGFVYLRARYYDPATAQFLTRDPSWRSPRRPTATWGAIR